MSNWYKECSPVERKTFWASFGAGARCARRSDVQPGHSGADRRFRHHESRCRSPQLDYPVFGAIGGWFGGALGDRFGRVKALQITVATFALATFACAFVTSYNQLLVLKAIQGLGFGAEWACGAVLMAEIIRPENRGRALAAVQSAWAVGWGVAVLLSAIVFTFVEHEIAWRLLFALGLLPALLIIFIRRGIPEPRRATAKADQPPFWQTVAGIFRPDVLRFTLIGALFGTGAHGGYAALTTFLPTYLREVRQLSVLGSSAYLAVIIVAFFCGCIVSGMLSDRLGRRVNVTLLPVPAWRRF